MLTRWLNGWPLRRQVLCVIVGTILVVALTSAELLRRMETRAIERSFADQAQMLVRLLAATSLEAVLSEDRPVLGTMVSQLAEVDPQIEKISIFNEDDLLLSTWSRTAGTWKAPLAPRIHYSQNVSLSDQTFGRIAVTWNVSEQHEAIRRQTLAIYRYAATIALVVGVLMVLNLRAFVLKPLQRIEAYARQLQLGVAGTPLQPTGARELAGITAALNDWRGVLDLRASIADALQSAPRGVDSDTDELRPPAFADLTTVDLEELIEQAVVDQAELAHAKGLELIAFLSPGLSRYVVGDRVRLQQVLGGLVANAVRFTASGDIRVHVDCVNPVDEPAILRFSIIDSGIGIDRGLQADVFDSSGRQARQPAAAAYPDLSICRQLIEGMGGLIGVDSLPGKGNVFWFELTLPAAGDRRTEVPDPTLAGRRILLVESHTHVREQLLTLLRFHRMLVDCEATAEAGLACLRQARHADRLHEILLFDDGLPDMRGDVFTRCIDADPDLDSLHLLGMVRHSADTRVTDRPPEARLRGLIHRPVRRRELTRLLVDTLNSQEQRRRPDEPPASDEAVQKAA